MRLLKGIDWNLLTAVFLISAMSLAIIFDIAPRLFYKQLFFIAVGFLLMFIVSLLDYRFLKSASFSLYAVMIAVLLAVLLFGSEIRGTRSWFGFGDLGLQPVELAKLIIVIILAKYLSLYYREIYRIRHLLVSGFFIVIPLFLIILQPDLGSAAALIGIWLVMLIVAGLRWRYLLVIFLIVMIAVVVGWQWGLKDYQKNRLRTFIDPSRDPLGQGYNVIQSIIAVGSGGILGQGLGYGTQSQLNFLPEKHTDFIFAVIAEELGFLGVFFLLSFYGYLFWRIYLIALGSRDNFGRFFAIGVLIMFALHVIINIGMNLGLAPVVGIPLIFLSYGGSNLIASFMALGILQNIRKNSIVIHY